MKKKRIVFIGKHNVGKSSLVNAFIGGESYVVNEGQAPLKQFLEISMELPPYGSVVIVDTISLNESAEAKQNHLNKTMEILSAADFVVVVMDARDRITQIDRSIFHQLKNLSIPFLAAVNKIEYGINSELINALRALNITHFEISCKESVGIDSLKSRVTRLLQLESSNE